LHHPVLIMVIRHYHIFSSVSFVVK
jgi:hypothetical protein